MADEKPQVGFIGTGLMGGPMAMRLAAAGYPLSVWNRTAAKTKSLEVAGAVAAPSPAALTRDSRIVFLCVTDTAAVEAVVFGEQGVAEHASSDKILVDMSSIKPQATQSLAKRLRDETGMRWIDAPVSGGVVGVERGTLVVMAGGEADDFNVVKPVMESFAGRVTLMGPTGAGQTTKLINQALVGISFFAVAEATRLALNAGVDVMKIPTALGGGRADSTVLQEYMPRMAAADFTPEGHIEIMLKDLDTVHELAKATSTPMPITAAACELHRVLVAQGEGKSDNAAVIKLYGDRGAKMP